MAHMATSLPPATQLTGRPKPPVPPKPEVPPLSPAPSRTRGTQVNLCRKGSPTKLLKEPSGQLVRPVAQKKSEPIYSEIPGGEESTPLTKPELPPKPLRLLLKNTPPLRPPPPTCFAFPPEPRTLSPPSSPSSTSSFRFASSFIQRSRSLTSDFLCWGKTSRSPPDTPISPQPPPRSAWKTASLGRNQAPPTSFVPPHIKAKSSSLGRHPPDILPWPSNLSPPLPPPRSRRKGADGKPKLHRSISLGCSEKRPACAPARLNRSIGTDTRVTPDVQKIPVSPSRKAPGIPVKGPPHTTTATTPVKAVTCTPAEVSIQLTKDVHDSSSKASSILSKENQLFRPKDAPLTPTRQAPPIPRKANVPEESPAKLVENGHHDQSVQCTESEAVISNPKKTTPIYATVNKKRSSPPQLQQLELLPADTVDMGNTSVVGTSGEAKVDTSAEEAGKSSGNPPEPEEPMQVQAESADTPATNLQVQNTVESANAKVEESSLAAADGDVKVIDRDTNCVKPPEIEEAVDAYSEQCANALEAKDKETCATHDEENDKDMPINVGASAVDAKSEDTCMLLIEDNDASVELCDLEKAGADSLEIGVTCKNEESQESSQETVTQKDNVSPNLQEPATLEDLEEGNRSSDNIESNVLKLEGTIGNIAELLEGLEQVVDSKNQIFSRPLVEDRDVISPESKLSDLRSTLGVLTLGQVPVRSHSWAGADKMDCRLSPVSSSSSQDFQNGKKNGKRWCDEGELSGGFLADDDSTDAPVGGDDDMTDAPSPIRKRVAAILLGKGTHKRSPRSKQKRFERSGNRSSLPTESMSRFYLDPVPSSEATSSAPLAQAEGSIGGASVSSDDEEEEPPESPMQEDPQAKKQRKAFLIARELATSEKAYVDALNLLTRDFKHAVELSLSLSEGDLTRLLGSLPQLQRLNEDLLSDLEARVMGWEKSPRMAQVIAQKGPFLKLYADYVRNFEAQCAFLDELRTRIPAFGRASAEFEASPRCRMLGLKHYMLKPVQRIPQYRLLLQDYLAHLEEDSPDYQDTLQAIRVVEEAAAHADNSLRLGDNMERMLSLQRQLGSYELIRPGRSLLKEGELFKLGRKERQPRFFILLSDCLLYTSYSGGHPGGSLKVHSELPLSGMRISCTRDDNTADAFQTEFSVISIARSFSLSCSSAAEREEWMTALKEAIEENANKRWSFASAQSGLAKTSPTDASAPEIRLGKEAPVWIPDARVTMCQQCTAHFTVTFRRHHCRACGKVICGHCSANRAPLEYRKNDPARVCDFCFDRLYKELQSREACIREELRPHFKRVGVGSGVAGSGTGAGEGGGKRFIPSRLKEVCANDAGSQMSGWLWWKAGGSGSGKGCKRNWFVLKDRVLYFYGASQDVVALQSLPVLGYLLLHSPNESFPWQEGLEPKLVFQLSHAGQPPLIFQAETPASVQKWVCAMKDAIVL